MTIIVSKLTGGHLIEEEGEWETEGVDDGWRRQQCKNSWGGGRKQKYTIPGQTKKQE